MLSGRNSGSFALVLVVLALITVALIIKKAIDLYIRSGLERDVLASSLDAILFWGGFALISGVLGTLVGIIIASQAIEAAAEVSTRIIWGGIKVSMLSSAFGAMILGFAALLWFVLQLRWRLLLADESSQGG